MHRLENITVIIVTYLTQKQLLINCLKSIDTRVKVKIIENSQNFEHREEILSSFNNVEIVSSIPMPGSAGMVQNKKDD